MNRKAREIYGVNDIKDIKGKKCYEILSGSCAPCACCNHDRLKEGFFLEEVRYIPIIRKKMVLKDTVVEENGRRYRFELAVDLGAWEQQNIGYEANEAMVNEGLRLALAAHTPEQSIDVLLEYLGQSLQSERVYIFEESGRKMVNNTYEWCANDVIPQKENLQDVPFEVVSMWYQRFVKGESVIIKNVENIKEEDAAVYEYLTPQKIRSLVVTPLVNEGEIIGFYGVDNPPEKFLEHITTLLQILGHFLVALIHRRNQMRRLEELCFEDQLTGIGNRHAVHDYFEKIDSGRSVGILYCDVMGLKKMNDSMGHKAGDQLLIRSSECLKKVFKEYELFRVGGDEFLAVCAGIEEQELNRRMEQLKCEMKEHNAPMALGSVWRAESKEQMDKLLTLADDRMYENKRKLYATEYKEMAR
ncbi:MAG: sensor domain-containing diguanylate cyclase [Lachnospiraceae bacterium]|nr:sensor domain-containing diguanylate cyclase [Lachnospiraceae bacterium]